MNIQRILSIALIFFVFISTLPESVARGGRGGGGGRSGSKSGFLNALLHKDVPYERPDYRPSSRGRAYYPSGYTPPSDGMEIQPPSEPTVAPAVSPNPAKTQAPAVPPVPVPPAAALAPSECYWKGWCYTTISADGVKKAETNPSMDISYPPTYGQTSPRIIITNN